MPPLVTKVSARFMPKPICATGSPASHRCGGEQGAGRDSARGVRPDETDRENGSSDSPERGPDDGHPPAACLTGCLQLRVDRV